MARPHRTRLDLRDARLRALWSLVVQVDPKLAAAETVRIYRDRLSTLPDARAANPIERSLLLERRYSTYPSSRRRTS